MRVRKFHYAAMFTFQQSAKVCFWRKLARDH